MNRDKKLGLALGVLLVGVVGAFFFRNEPTPSLEAPRLNDPQKLDDRISERPVIPYLNEGDDDRVRGESAHRDPRGDEPTTVSRRDDSPRREENGMFAPDPRGDRAFGDPPDPIPLVDRPASGDDGRNHPPTRIARGSGSENPSTSPPSSPPAATVHVVKPGETLSGLAQRYLGSSARFDEIFEANRDQLKSSHDVRVGLKLRIPPRDGSPGTRRTTPSAPSASRTSIDPTPSPPKGASSSNTSRKTERAERSNLPEPFSDLASGPARTMSSKPRGPLPGDPRAVDFPEVDDRPFSGERSTSGGRAPSGGASPAQLLEPEPFPSSAAAPGRYVVLRGDTLERIAQRLFGDRTASRRIYDANRDVLVSEDAVREGMTLRIPER